MHAGSTGPEPPANPSTGTSSATDTGPWCRGVIEVEAESVAYLVTQAHGLDASQYTFTYVAGWAHSAASGTTSVDEIITATGKRVIAAADRILTQTQPQPTIVEEAIGDLRRTVERSLIPAVDRQTGPDPRTRRVTSSRAGDFAGRHAPAPGRYLS